MSKQICYQLKWVKKKKLNKSEMNQKKSSSECLQYLSEPH